MNAGEVIFFIIFIAIYWVMGYLGSKVLEKRFNEIHESIAWIGATMELKDKSDKLLIEKLENAYSGLVAHEARIQELEKQLENSIRNNQ